MHELIAKDELKEKLSHHTRWYWTNRIFRDYSQAISLIISVSIPTGLLIIPTLTADLQRSVNTWLIVVTLAGLLLSLTRSVFRFESRTEHNGKMLYKLRSVALKYDNKEMTDPELVQALIEIEKAELDEIHY